MIHHFTQMKQSLVTKKSATRVYNSATNKLLNRMAGKIDVFSEHMRPLNFYTCFIHFFFFFSLNEFQPSNYFLQIKIL